jgi:hypothetical protein
VAVLGRRGASRTEAAIARGARALGHRARLIDVAGWYRRLGSRAGWWLRSQVDRFAPDIVILTRYAADLDDGSLRAVLRRRRSALWFFDLVERPHERIVRLARAAQQMFVTCPSQIELYRKAGASWVGFLPQAVDPGLDRPARWNRRRYRCDVSFVGSGHYPHRHELLRRVATDFKLQIRGPGWGKAPEDLPVAGGPVRGRAFARVVRGAAISLGAHAFPSQRKQWACASNRMWKILGCGGFYLGPWVSGVEILARGGEHCVWYETPEEAIELIRRYLPTPDARSAIAGAGRAHALSAHTYAHRLELLLEGRAYPLESPGVAQTRV